MPDIATPADLAPRRALAMGMMVVGSVAISFGGLVIRNIEAADTWQINFYRSVAFVATILTVMLIRYRGRTVENIRRVGMPGFLGGAMLAAAGIAFLQAITNTTVANTLFTVSSIPFLTAALAWLFLRERLNRATLVTMAVAALGIGVMVAEGIGAGSLYGNAMALVTALCFSGFAVVVRRYRQIDMLSAAIVSGLLAIAVAVVVRRGDFAVPVEDILLCVLLGTLLSGVANVLFIFASRHLAAAELTLFMLLEFALGPIWVWIFINEVPAVWTLAGGVIVILSVAARALIDLRGPPRWQRRGRPSPM